MKATGANDCPVRCFQQLAELSEGDNVYGSWKTQNVSLFLLRNNFSFTIHQIRVLTVLSLTALGWSDADIRYFLCWKSAESLDSYRLGTSMAGLKKLPELRHVYGTSEEAKRILRAPAQANGGTDRDPQRGVDRERASSQAGRA